MEENNLDKMANGAERLAAAAGTLEKVLAQLQASQEALHVKVDRIIAAIEEGTVLGQQASGEEAGLVDTELRDRLAEAERQNRELKAQTARLTRKTLSPLVSGLLSKNGVEESASAVESGVLDKALATLSPEQRIAVKAELARAGLIA